MNSKLTPGRRTRACDRQETAPIDKQLHQPETVFSLASRRCACRSLPRASCAVWAGVSSASFAAAEAANAAVLRVTVVDEERAGPADACFAGVLLSCAAVGSAIFALDVGAMELVMSVSDQV